MKERFSLASATATHLDVETVCTGSLADAMRASVARLGLQDLQRSSVARYSKLYGRTAVRMPPVTSDDVARNHFSVREHYVLLEMGSRSQRAVSAWSFHDPVTLPSNTGEAADGEHPLWLRHVLELEDLAMAKNWEDRKNIEGAGFSYRYRTKHWRHTLTVSHELVPTTDRVTPTEAPKYERGIGEVRSRLETKYQTGDPLPAPGEQGTPWVLVVGTLAILFAASWSFKPKD